MIHRLGSGKNLEESFTLIEKLTFQKLCFISFRDLIEARTCERFILKEESKFKSYILYRSLARLRQKFGRALF